jgi:hypothetical protein
MNKQELIKLIRDNLSLLTKCDTLDEANKFISDNPSDEFRILIVQPNKPTNNIN